MNDGGKGTSSSESSVGVGARVALVRCIGGRDRLAKLFDFEGCRRMFGMGVGDTLDMAESQKFVNGRVFATMSISYMNTCRIGCLARYELIVGI